jgi:short-subunit dehydrogenase
MSVYGRLTDVPVADEQAVFAVNFWGTVYGMKEAVSQLRDKGGAVINVGSEVSDHPVPMQGAYTVSKHAVKAYTDAFRVELEEANVPVSVTLIKPAGIATPFFEHAKNYMREEPVPPPSVYAPEAVAEAILYAAEIPTRDFLVGDSAVLNSLIGRFAPILNDKIMKIVGFKFQQAPRQARTGDHQALEPASGELKERSDYGVTVAEACPHNKAARNPRWTTALTVAAAAAVATALRRRSNSL